MTSLRLVNADHDDHAPVPLAQVDPVVDRMILWGSLLAAIAIGAVVGWMLGG